MTVLRLVKREPVPHVVAALRALLEMAERGDLYSLAAAYEYFDGEAAASGNAVNTP